MAEALIIDAVRTPRGIGKVGKGALADMHPQQLAATRSSRRWLERNDLDTADVDDIIWGTSIAARQAGRQTSAAWPRSTRAIRRQGQRHDTRSFLRLRHHHA